MEEVRGDRIFWVPENPDDEPGIILHMQDGRECIMTRFNSMTIKHIGSLAVYDHILYDELTPAPVITPFRVYWFSKSYDNIEHYMKENGFPSITGKTSINKELGDHYQQAVLLETQEEIPEDWFDKK